MPLKALIWAAVSTRRQTDEEKFSLPEQEQNARDLCAREGWQIIDVLRVPGHTRSAYMEFHKLADAAHKKGMDAFLKLQEHWEARDFDVLIIRDGDRLARAQGVMGTIVESVIHTNARIYCFADGWVDQNNFRMWIAMVGYRAASDVDKLRKFLDSGANKRAERGLPVGSGVLWSHKVIRGDNGRALYQIPDPDKALFFQDAATLILEGISWYNIEQELFRRFGHANPEGQPWPPRKVYCLVYNPSFWGNEARFFRDARRKSQFKGAWAFDESIPAPKGVVMFYGVHKPVYEGELARQIQQEARRRESIIRGSGRANRSYRFTGLVICGECGCNVLTQRRVKGNMNNIRLYCYTKHRTLSYATCTQYKGIAESYVAEMINAKLEEAILSRDLDSLLGVHPIVEQTLSETLKAEIEALEAEARQLIQKQGKANESLSTMYDVEIDKVGLKLATARQRYQAERRPVINPEQRKTQARTLGDIAEMTLVKFWQLPDNVINQKLHALLGKRRFVMLNGKIIDQMDAPPRRRF